jgi:CelD/BcsL family acetyltransferase involved in cellulose biosynthesis
VSVDLVVGAEGLEHLTPNWTALEEAVQPTVFQTQAWARIWLRHFGKEAQPWILVTGSPPTALLALVLKRSGPVRVLRLLGHGLSDYPGALARDEDPERWEAWGRRLRQEAHRFDLVHFGALLASEAERAAFARGMGARAASRLYERCPVIETDLPWEEFLRARSKKFRKNIRQRENHMSRLGAQVARETPTADLFEEVLEVEREAWKWQHGLSYTRNSSRRDFLRDLMLSGEVRHEFWTCRVNGELVAFALVFPTRHRRIDYLSSFRVRFNGVGAFLLSEMVRESCGSEFEEVDLGQGDEAYKLFWSTRERCVFEVVAPGRRLLALPAYAAVRIRWILARSERLRGWATRLRSRLTNTLSGA